MYSCRYLTFVSRRSRRFLTVVSLVAYLASVWGYPLPQAATVDRSVPFPCQDHHCGCASAEQCWRSCCCFTPAERIAWADKHGVTIPEPMRMALEAEEHSHHAHEICRAENVCEASNIDHKPGALLRPRPRAGRLPASLQGLRVAQFRHEHRLGVSLRGPQMPGVVDAVDGDRRGGSPGD